MNLTLIINSEELLNPNYQDKGKPMNGLERFGCQTIIYTPRNTFFLNSPNLARDGYKFWNLGWFDFKNILFYQTNILLENKLERVQFFSLWIDFLQTLITNQIYKNLFEAEVGIVKLPEESILTLLGKEIVVSLSNSSFKYP